MREAKGRRLHANQLYIQRLQLYLQGGAGLGAIDISIPALPAAHKGLYLQ